MRNFLNVILFSGLFLLMISCSTIGSKTDTGNGNDVINDAAGEDVQTPPDVRTDMDANEVSPGADVPAGEDVTMPIDNIICDDSWDIHDNQDANEVSPDADVPAGEDVTMPIDNCICDPGQDISQPGDLPADTTPPPRPGECVGKDDCGGHKCVNIKSINFHVCTQDTPQEFTQCGPPKSDLDECCSSADCDAGGCYKTTPINYMGGMPVSPHKMCIADECHKDSDCNKKDNRGNVIPGLCLPAGINGWPKTRCVVNDCAAFGGCKEGSYCRLMTAPCSPGTYMGSFCASPNTCETNKDCKNGEECIGDTKTGTTKCKVVYCPAL